MNILATESARHLSLLRDYWQTFTDPAHLLSEASFEAITGLILYPFARMGFKYALRKHDKEVHNA